MSRDSVTDKHGGVHVIRVVYMPKKLFKVLSSVQMIKTLQYLYLICQFVALAADERSVSLPMHLLSLFLYETYATIYQWANACIPFAYIYNSSQLPLFGIQKLLYLRSAACPTAASSLPEITKYREVMGSHVFHDSVLKK